MFPFDNVIMRRSGILYSTAWKRHLNFPILRHKFTLIWPGPVWQCVCCAPCQSQDIRNLHTSKHILFFRCILLIIDQLPRLHSTATCSTAQYFSPELFCDRINAIAYWCRLNGTPSTEYIYIYILHE